MWFLLTLSGTRPISIPLGHAADFCKICRKIVSCTVSRVRVVPHLYFIPIGKGRGIGFEFQCHDCGVKTIDDMQRFPTLASVGKSDLTELLQLTNPSAYEIHADRMALEKRLARDSDALSADERQRLLLEPFEIAAEYDRNRSGAEGVRFMVLALRPLNPVEGEIRACLQYYRRQGEIIGARLRTADLMDQIYADRLPRNPDAFDY